MGNIAQTLTECCSDDRRSEPIGQEKIKLFRKTTSDSNSQGKALIILYLTLC